jgi:hypothetical protein
MSATAYTQKFTSETTNRSEVAPNGEQRLLVATIAPKLSWEDQKIERTKTKTKSKPKTKTKTKPKTNTTVKMKVKGKDKQKKKKKSAANRTHVKSQNHTTRIANLIKEIPKK